MTIGRNLHRVLLEINSTIHGHNLARCMQNEWDGLEPEAFFYNLRMLQYTNEKTGSER